MTEEHRLNLVVLGHISIHVLRAIHLQQVVAGDANFQLLRLDENRVFALQRLVFLAVTRKSLLISLFLPHVRVLRLERGSLVGGRLPHVHVRCPVLVFPVETRLASQGGVLVVGAVIGARLSPVTAVTRDRRVRWRLALVRHLKRLIWSVDFHGDWFWS